MADVKITALTAISANPVNPATFPMPMVDLLDNSMAASGSTRKVTVNQILGAGGTATLASAAITGAATVGTTLGVTGASTLASATITGALVVDTTTLVANAAGYTDKVGIGTATPSQALHVRGNILTGSAAGTDSYINITTDGVQNSYFGFNNSGSTNGLGASNNNTYIGSGNNYPVQIVSNGALVATFSSSTVRIANNNIVMATSGTGIDFSATANPISPIIMTSELLNDYEEGTWTPAQGTGLSVSGIFSSSGTYTKVGRSVYITGVVNAVTSLSATASGIICSGLPFSASAQAAATAMNGPLNAGSFCAVNATDFYAVSAVAATTSLRFSATYSV